MKTKHTEGTWVKDDTFIKVGNRIIAEVYNDHNFLPNPSDPDGQQIPSKEEGEANEKLIAAAPELLECLLFFEKFDDVEVHSKEWEKLAARHLDMVEKAIAKATK